METIQTKQTQRVSLKSIFLGGSHTLVMRGDSLGSVMSDMALYYTQYKHTKLGWRSYLGIN